MKPPRVSIVVATYCTRREHLTQAIESALAQTMPAIEVIVSDDSPDDSLREFIDRWRDPRLRYRHNAPALGVARSHWKSFAEARGEYVVILNHDDWLAPGHVESLAAALDRHADATLAFCDHWIIDVDGKRLDADTDRNSAAWGRAGLAAGLHAPFTSLVVAQTIPIAAGAMFRRAALTMPLPDDAGPAYDLWLSYLLCRPGAAAVYVADRLSAWRTHEGNLSSAGGLSWLHGAALCWQAMRADPAFRPWRALARRRAAAAHAACALRCWAGGDRAQALAHAGRSMAARPSARGLLACALPLLPHRWAAQRWNRGSPG